MNRTRGRTSQAGAGGAAHGPVDVLSTQLGLVKLAQMTGDWAGATRERDRALHLILGHRIEDEIRRFRRALTACAGWQDSGEDVRLRIGKRLTDAFTEGITRRESPRDLLLSMQRIPRTTALQLLVKELESDATAFIEFLLVSGKGADDDSRAVAPGVRGRAARFTRRDWGGLATALMAVDPAGPLDEVASAGRAALCAMQPSAALG